MTQAKRPAQTPKGTGIPKPARPVTVDDNGEVALTGEQVQRGLWPKTMADLKYRPYVFTVMARAEAEHRKRKAAKAK